jgi:PRA1 family protein
VLECAQRNWGEFFSSIKAPEPDYTKLEKRVAANLLHFTGNYVLVAAGVAVLHGLTQAPSFLLAAALGLAAAVVLLRPPKQLKPQLRKLQLDSDRTRTLAAAGVAAGIVLLSGNLLSLLYVTAIGGLLILAHAALHSQSLSATVSSWTTQRRYEVERVAQDMDAPSSSSSSSSSSGSSSSAAGGMTVEEVERAEAGAGRSELDAETAGGIEHSLDDMQGDAAHQHLQHLHGSAPQPQHHFHQQPAPAVPFVSTDASGAAAAPSLGSVDPASLPRPRGAGRGKKSD